MNYQIAICDDEESIIDYSVRCLKEWAKERGHLIDIDTFTSAEAFEFQYAEDKLYHILLLDIEMPGISGVDLAKKLRRENEEIQIIFITGYMDYISEGYEVAALHYLLKPINPEKLKEVLDKAVHRIDRQEHPLCLMVEGEMIYLPLHTIRYISVQQNYVTIYGRTEYTIKKTLTEVGKLLDERFFRLGRSYMVNLNSIYSISRKEVLLKTGEKLPLPRGYYESINQAMIRYF